MVAVGVARIRGDELTAPIDLVADGRHLVLVAAGAEEAEHLCGWRVLVENPGDVTTQSSLFMDAFLHWQALVVAQLLGNRGVQLLS